MGLDMSLDLRPNQPLKLLKEIVRYNQWKFRKAQADKALTGDIIALSRLAMSTGFFSEFIPEDHPISEEDARESIKPEFLKGFLEGASSADPEVKKSHVEIMDFINRFADANEPTRSEEALELLKEQPALETQFYTDTPAEDDPNYDQSFMQKHSIDWRKENHIHKWFVQHVQDDEDDCEDYVVSKTQLLAFKSTLEEAIAEYDDQMKRHGQILYSEELEKILPTSSGFFFGGTAYDEWYDQANRRSLEFVTEALKEVDFEKYMFIYSSSW